MIKSIEIINRRNEHTVIELSDPRPTGFFIVSVDGLEPPKGTINMSNRSRLDGRLYNGSRANGRNIVLNLRYFWGNLNNDSIEAIRHKTYRMCPIGENVRIIVHTDLREVYFDGYVETNEINILSKFEQSQISILCEDAYGKGSTRNATDSFTGITPLFEFPFSNESLTEPLIEFGNIYSVTGKLIECESEVKTGFIFKCTFGDIINGITITNATTNKQMKISDTFLEGDKLEVCTITGNKYVKKNGTNIIGKFYTNASNDWVELSSGGNYITVRDINGADVFDTSLIDIEYPLLYAGV